MANKLNIVYEFDNFAVPLKIIVEWRRSVRISITKKSANLRLPSMLPKILKRKEISRAQDWIKETIQNEPKVFSRFLNYRYDNQFEKRVMDSIFNIEVKREIRKRNTGKIKGSQLVLSISKDIDAHQERNVIKKLQSRLFAKYFHYDFSNRVMELNEYHFRYDFNNIRLKYNQSNWGSCSSKTNLNFSTRLLLCPSDVIDYVIIHELAHLKEMNHSAKFWNLVSTAMPEYKVKEKWLKKNGESCDY